MFDKILVPLDGSSLAECALPHVTALAGAYNAEVVLLRVIEGDGGLTARTADPLAWQMRKMEATAYLDTVQSRLGAVGIEARLAVMEGSAPQRIVDYAQAEHCDLLVMSTHGKSGLAPWSAGSVTKKVVEQVKSSLLLVRAFEELPERAPLQRYERILVPLDGSQRAEAILPAAMRLARYCDATLVLMHIVPCPSGLGQMSLAAESAELATQLMKQTEAEAVRYLARLQKQLPVPCEVQVAVGDRVIQTLAEAVSRYQIDLVLLSAHGTGGDPRRRYGSLISETILYGSAPLLIYQDMPPEQIAATVVERALGVRELNSSWTSPRPERMNWHAAQNAA